MSSVLETFFFAFKADTAPVIEGIDDVTDAVQKSQNEISGLGGAFGKVAGAVGGVYLLKQAFDFLKAGISESAEEMNRMVEASAVTGMAVGELDAWSKSVEDAGGSAEAFQGTLKGLAADMAMVQVKGKSRKMAFFEEIGINYKAVKDTSELLPLLADQFSKMSAEEALGMGSKMGIDEKTITLLRGGRAEIEMMLDRQKKLGVITEEDAAKVAEFDNAMDEMSRVFQNIWRMLTIKIIPVLTDVGEAFTDLFLWMKEHESTIVTFSKVFAFAVGVVMVGAIYSFMASMELATAVAIISWIAMAWPIFVLIAAIAAISAAIFLVIDDFKTWQEGGDSMIGRLIGSFADFEKKVKAVFQSVSDYWDRVIENITDGIEKVVQGLEKAKGLWSDMKGGANALASDVGGALGIGSDAQAAASASPYNAAPQSGGNTQNRNTSVQVGSVTVNTQATDAAGVAGGLSDELSKQMQEAVAGHDDGVAA